MEEKENINVKANNNQNVAKGRYEKRKTAFETNKTLKLVDLIGRLNKFSEMLLPQLGMAMGVRNKNERRNTK